MALGPQPGPPGDGTSLQPPQPPEQREAAAGHSPCPPLTALQLLPASLQPPHRGTSLGSSCCSAPQPSPPLACSAHNSRAQLPSPCPAFLQPPSSRPGAAPVLKQRQQQLHREANRTKTSLDQQQIPLQASASANSSSEGPRTPFRLRHSRPRCPAPGGLLYLRGPRAQPAGAESHRPAPGAAGGAAAASCSAAEGWGSLRLPRSFIALLREVERNGGSRLRSSFHL